MAAGETNVSFAIDAFGENLTFQWFKDGVPLNNGGVIAGATAANLKISQAKPSDAGNYSVVITDDQGSTTSSNALLTLKAPVTLLPVAAWPAHRAGEAKRVAIQDHKAYVALADSGLLIYDLQDPAQPVRLGYRETPLTIEHLVISGSRAYLGSQEMGLMFMDVSDSFHPGPLVACSYTAPAYGLAAYGSYAIVARGNFDLLVADLSDLSRPAIVGRCDPDGYTWAVAVTNNYAYVVGNRGFRVVNLSDPRNPTVVGHCSMNGRHVEMYGNYALVTTDGSRFAMIDVSNPATPTLTGYCDVVGATGEIVVRGSHAYVTMGDKRLQVIDLHDPARPAGLGIYTGEGGCSFSEHPSQAL